MTNLNRFGLSTVCGLFLAAALTACSDRNELLAESDPSFAENCAALSGKSSLKVDLSRNANAVESANVLTGYWNKSPNGQKLAAQLSQNDTGLCFDAPQKSYNGYIKNKRGNVFQVSRIETAARGILRDATTSAYGKAVQWSEKLVPEDALLLSRVQKAHEVNVQISDVYLMAGKNFESPLWKDAESDKSIAQYATEFRTKISEGSTESKAFSSVLLNILQKENVANDKEFLTWYDKFLHTHSESTMSMCLGFDGHLDPCLTSKDVPPAKTTAASRLTHRELIEVSATLMQKPYLDQSSAQKIIDTKTYRNVSNGNHESFETVLRDADECCKDASRHGGGSGGNLGYGLGRGKIGIAF